MCERERARVSLYRPRHSSAKRTRSSCSPTPIRTHVNAQAQKGQGHTPTQTRRAAAAARQGLCASRCGGIRGRINIWIWWLNNSARPSNAVRRARARARLAPWGKDDDRHRRQRKGYESRFCWRRIRRWQWSSDGYANVCCGRQRDQGMFLFDGVAALCSTNYGHMAAQKNGKRSSLVDDLKIRVRAGGKTFWISTGQPTGLFV
jgi:hypothetical protein